MLWGEVFDVLTLPAILPAPPKNPSACLSDSPSVSDESLSPDVPPVVPPLLFDAPALPPAFVPEEPVVPFAPALTVLFMLFLPFASTFTLLPVTLLRNLDLVVSLRTLIPNAPPTATLSPVAVALAATCLESALVALSNISSFELMRLPLPSVLSVAAPATITATTGVTDIPPAEPAVLSNVWVSVVSVVMVTPPANELSLKLTPSSIYASVSIPVTATPIPAPMPAFVPL